MDLGFPIGILVALCGLGVASEGLGCAGVPGLAEIGPLLLRRGGTHFPPFPWPLSLWCWDWGLALEVLLLLTLLSTMASMVARLMVLGEMKVFQTPRISW